MTTKNNNNNQHRFDLLFLKRWFFCCQLALTTTTRQQQPTTKSTFDHNNSNNGNNDNNNDNDNEEDNDVMIENDNDDHYNNDSSSSSSRSSQASSTTRRHHHYHHRKFQVFKQFINQFLLCLPTFMHSLLLRLRHISWINLITVFLLFAFCLIEVYVGNEMMKSASKFTSAIVDGCLNPSRDNRKNFFAVMAATLAWILGMNALKTVRMVINDALIVGWRTNLTLNLQGRYLRNETFYQLLLLDKRVDNPYVSHCVM